MLDVALEKYPVRTTLSDGTPCSIRPMEANDEPAFKQLHELIPDQEQTFIKNRIRDGTLFREWMSDPEFHEHLPLLAFVDGRAAAMGSLHRRPGGWKRHIGRVYFLTSSDHKGMGLIDKLLDEIVELSQHCGLTRLESELNGERESAIRAMGAVGFKELMRLPDYIQDMSAEYHDYVLMGLELVPEFENLGVGD